MLNVTLKTKMHALRAVARNHRYRAHKWQPQRERGRGEAAGEENQEDSSREEKADAI